MTYGEICRELDVFRDYLHKYPPEAPIEWEQVSVSPQFDCYRYEYRLCGDRKDLIRTVKMNFFNSRETTLSEIRTARECAALQKPENRVNA